MRRRTLYSTPTEGKPIIEANYADICYYNSDTEQFVIVDVTDIDKYTDARYTPIGVVVVPSSHTDEGRPRIISLVNMSCNTPNTGSTSYENIYYGGYGYVVSGLAQKTMRPYIGTSPSSVTANGTVKFEDKTCYLPSDEQNWIYTNPSNSNEHFFNNISSYNYMCSPYKQDGSKDERYFEEANSANVYSILADFNGKTNTDKILAHDNSNSTSWQISTSINNVKDNQYIHPAAQCCWRFHTVGTSQGDWYLPAAGELGYVLVRKQAIQNSLQVLASKGYTVSSHNTDYHWSSTQYVDTGIIIDFIFGYLGADDNDNPVRALLTL